MTAPPANYDALKKLIAARYPSMPGQLQRIAQFALDNPNELALETVSKLAGRVDVQPSSMVRFAKSLGYDGFSGLQSIFRSRLVADNQSYEDRIRSMREAQGRGGVTPDATLATFVEEGIASLQMLQAGIPGDMILDAVKILADADEIYLIARNRSFPVVFYLAYALSKLGRKCRLLDGVGGLLTDQARLASSRDAVLAVSFHPYTASVVDVVGGFREAGLPIVAITDSALSPLALQADVSFELREREERTFRTLVAPMCLAQCLVVQLGHELDARRSGNGK